MKTVLTHLPKGWETKRLGDLCFILKRGKSPVYSDINEGVVIVNQDCIRWDYIDLSKVKFHKVPHKQNAESLLRIGDILLNSTGTGTIGRLNQWNNNDLIAFADSHVTVIRLNTDLINPIFVKYLLSNFEAQAYLEAVCFTGSTNQIELSRRYLFKMEFPYPSNPSEQTAIASILSKVDAAIEATQNSIKAVEKLKKSLMQNLFSGKLKPDGTWRTEDEFYVDEKFGKVPNGWEVKKLKKIFKLKNGKGNPKENLKSDPINDFKIPVYGGNGITGYFNSPFLQKSTLIIGRVGEYCGSVYRTPQLSWVTDNALWISEIMIDNFDLDFWHLLLILKKLNQYNDATGQPKITQSGIGNLKTIYPPSLIEQVAISARIVEIDNYITSKDFKNKTLQRLKKSLMQNLLTGKVRVDVEKINELLNK